MSDQPATPPERTPQAPARKPEDDCQSVVIRQWPKVIFLYPTLLAALVAAAWTYLAADGGPIDVEQLPLGPGRLFWWTFAANMLALGFDFTRGEFVAVLLFFGMATLGIILLDQNLNVVKPVQEVLSHIRLVAHPHMYLMMAAALAVVFAGVAVAAKFDYWEITHNEILHHKGFLGDLQRFPAPSLRLHKEIPDLFEYCLFFAVGGAGRIVLHPHGSERSVVLDNVIGVNRIEERIQKMLSTLKVKVDTSGHGGE